MKEKPAFRSPLFGDFRSERTPNATNDSNVNFVIYCFTFRDKPLIIELVVNSGDFLKLLLMRV
jgi:hypothetical protein